LSEIINFFCHNVLISSDYVTRLYTAFLCPNGRISHFFIPFHALSTSSSAERDLKTQARIHMLLEQDPRLHTFLPSLADELDGIKNIQLKTYLVSSIMTKEQHKVTCDEAAALVINLIDKCQQQEDKNLPLEQKLYLRKLFKLRQLIELFQHVEKLGHRDASFEEGNWAALSGQLSVRSVYLEDLQQMIREEEADTLGSDTSPSKLVFSDFLLCFELEGELHSSDR
jgi:hypothetical protein